MPPNGSRGSGIADRFPAAEIVFDAVPRWFSHLTLWGLSFVRDMSEL
jgi:hypothetical protein